MCYEQSDSQQERKAAVARTVALSRLEAQKAAARQAAGVWTACFSLEFSEIILEKPNVCFIKRMCLCRKSSSPQSVCKKTTPPSPLVQAPPCSQEPPGTHPGRAVAPRGAGCRETMGR